VNPIPLLLRTPTRALCLIVALVSVLALTHQVSADDPLFVPRQALIRLVPGASVEDFNARYDTAVVEAMPERSIFLLSLPESPNEQEFVDLFDVDPDVVYADLNFFAEDTDADGTTQDIFLARSFEQYVGDPAISLVGSQEANVSARGGGIIIAVIDTGIDATHPLLSGRIAPGGYNFIDNTTDTSDGGAGLFAGHGTMVSGIVLRIAPEAQILPLRVLDSDGSTTTFRLSRAIFHAIDAGAHVINISLGTLADPSLLADAITEAHSSGIIVVAAAGNDDAQSPPRSPASLSSSGVVAVAATDNQLIKAHFSNYGSWVSISAPGVSIHGPFPGAAYSEATGTSFAAPLVSGTAALVLSSCPGIDSETARQILISTAQPIDDLNPSFPEMLGTGLIDCAAAVGLAMNSETCSRCNADFNGNGNSEVPDIFAFLSAWFAQSPLADSNVDGAIGVTDIFLFLAIWFAGCP